MDFRLELNNNRDLQFLFGRHDQNLKIIEKELGVRIVRAEDGIKIIGSDPQLTVARELFHYLMTFVEKGKDVKKSDIVYALRLVDKDKEIDFKRLAKEKIEVSVQGLITPKTKGQIEYIEAIKTNDLVFCIGPAGTGKTYLAIAMAVNALKKGLVRRIVLTRPAVEAGENLGFLPGDMVEKVLPYLRPLYDALYDMMEPEKVEHYSEQGIIEVAPLAFMRGRTLNEAFVILDEAQNARPDQMKMFLTRMGFDSKVVVAGDVTQSDLPSPENNGLAEANRVLAHVPEIKFIHLTSEDTVRHELVQKIIEAYAQSNGSNKH
ncbi:MAG: PhoH family protein [Candidatus Omnitrophica bacterium]|nr:PhoH family protein [Candidatus Omnitrophota bacterium]MDE2008994.1 PhoH family protein [Candidatus Omnitrophota bacterium]MDE2214518.1 PhoH family protein [Candidatus Omnitrophota bacterium]MDE2230836.1 PhoH family protein [Candidatus Omnitrophota bacterium]